MAYKLNINKKTVTVDAVEDMPLLWALRDMLGLKGTKYGCGIGECGACTVLVDGRSVRSCQISVSEAQGNITTIEGLAENGNLHVLQQTWIDFDVAQCGYCQGGQILSAVALLTAHPKSTDAEINTAMGHNICRCATYNRIKGAIRHVAGTPAAAKGDAHAKA